MPIAELTRLVPAPSNPSEVETIKRWHAVERELGLVLPSDYRDLIFNYGSGLFARFYRVYNPFSQSEYTALIPSVRRVCEFVREKKKNWPNEVPYAIYPAEGGLMPWGNDENGNEYYWLTNGSPENWIVVSETVRGEGFREYGCSLTEFLTKVFLGHTHASVDDYFKDEDRVFVSWPVATE